jgi:murein DD-endopeptidase MepM/ murein hydrolase activator NlpD
LDFADPASTPVVAVAPATVEFAGPDWDVMFGPELRFYGNLIVLRITSVADGNGQPVFALYGHLSEIYFNTGDSVATGDIIGAVGGTGVANGGAHLHLEVRVGDPHDYNLGTRNPDLWIKPYFGYGTLAGKVVNGSGAFLPNVSITVRGADTTRYTGTYAGDINHPDATWGENFTLGDLPEGWYTVTTRSSSRTYSEDIYIRPNRTTWVEFDFN